jgi:hypothetical protein
MHHHAELKRVRPLSRRLRVGPIFRALIISVAVEVAALLLTLDALASSMMRHSGAAPRPAWEDLLAHIGLFFHLPSILITQALGLLPLAPLVQIAMMTYLLGLVFRARERARLR